MRTSMMNLNDLRNVVLPSYLCFVKRSGLLSSSQVFLFGSCLEGAHGPYSQNSLTRASLDHFFLVCWSADFFLFVFAVRLSRRRILDSNRGGFRRSCGRRRSAVVSRPSFAQHAKARAQALRHGIRQVVARIARIDKGGDAQGGS